MSVEKKRFAGVAGLAPAAMTASAVATGVVTIDLGPTPTVSVANPSPRRRPERSSSVTGTASGLRRGPWRGAALDAAGLCTSVGGGASATCDFELARSSLSFVLGSPDTYNDLRIGLRAAAEPWWSTARRSSPQPPSGIGANFVTVSGPGMFASVTFKSGNNAVEYANVAAVPLPAAGLLLPCGSPGLMARRKRAEI